MAAAVNDPFLLATYDVSTKFAGASTKHARQPALFVSHHRAGGKGTHEGCATVTVPGDGVHVLDVRSVVYARYAESKIAPRS